jgi:hypothetical protein
VFGERALLLDEARAATVIAVSAVVTCYTLDRHSVGVLGCLGVSWGALLWNPCFPCAWAHSVCGGVPRQISRAFAHIVERACLHGSSCSRVCVWCLDGTRHPRAPPPPLCLAPHPSLEQVHQLLGPLRDLFTHNMAVNVLRSVPMLACLSSAERSEVAKALRPTQYAQGALLCVQDDPRITAKCFFVVQEGQVALSRHAEVRVVSVGLGSCVLR